MRHNSTEDAKFEDLKGKKITKITGKEGDEQMVFLCSDGNKYTLTYYQDCCACCCVESIQGDLSDIIGQKLLDAREVTSHDHLDGTPEDSESFTWTFYTLMTRKGRVTIRWYGSSNGYYSESATFEKVVK